MIEGRRLPHLSVRPAQRRTDGEYDCAIVTNLDGRPAIVAECFGRLADDLRMDAEANARLFVDAVNNYADMSEALTAAVTELKQSAEFFGPCDHDVGACCCHLYSLIARCEAALAKAGICNTPEPDLATPCNTEARKLDNV